MTDTLYVLSEEVYIPHYRTDTSFHGVYSSLELAQAAAQRKETTPLVWNPDWCGAIRSNDVVGDGVTVTYEVATTRVDQDVL